MRTVRLAGDEDTDRAAIPAAALDPIDVVLDLFSRPAIGRDDAGAGRGDRVREDGTVVLTGGVDMLGGPTSPCRIRGSGGTASLVRGHGPRLRPAGEAWGGNTSSDTARSGSRRWCC